MTNANRPLQYADDVETIAADEADDIQRVVQALELILAQSKAKTGEFRADVHVKTHAYAQGEFRVLPNLPNELAQGLFEHDSIFPAVVRFSNSASQAQADAIPDGRGMAIKVLEVKGDMCLADDESGPTQDFVMINHPVFFARNVKDYLRLEQVLDQSCVVSCRWISPQIQQKLTRQAVWYMLYVSGSNAKSAPVRCKCGQDVVGFFQTVK